MNIYNYLRYILYLYFYALSNYKIKNREKNYANFRLISNLVTYYCPNTCTNSYFFLSKVFFIDAALA